MKRYKPIYKKFSERVKFADLMKNLGMSDMTKIFKKETDKLMGPPTKHSKLIQAKVNNAKDYITFIFATERTPIYKDNFNLQAVNPETFALHKDNLYTVEIRILDFFKLLGEETGLNEENITNNSIETVFLKADVQVWSDVPSFHWQGSNYHLSQLDGSIYPTNIPASHWDKYHGGKQLLDKHSAGILNSIKFYIPQMRMMVKKYLGKTKVKK